MAPRKTSTVKLKVVTPEETSVLPDLTVPDYFVGKFDRLYRDLVHEVIALRQAATPADLSIIETIVSSAQGEEECREFAKEAREEGDRDTYLKMSRMTQSFARAKALALASIGLSGDRRGASAGRRKEMGATNSSVVTGSGKGGRWGGLI